MKSKKSVLIVDDYLVDRMILERILSDEYDILQAENGREALDILAQKHDQIAGIILGLVMPVMDGYAFLDAMTAEEDYSNIPVIVSTGDMGNEHEVRALELGAWDFVAKPYDETILKFRLRNVITRSQLSAFERLKYLTEYDTLTGIYSKSKFFTETRKMINANPNNTFAFVRFDVDRFQLINSFFGSDGGDQLLRFIADGLKQTLGALECGTYGRIESDIFSFCVPYQTKEQVFQLVLQLSALFKGFKESFEVATVYGVYFIDNNELSTTTMFDRATLAAKSNKGNCTNPMAEYLPEMSEHLEQEQKILNEMGPALAEHQFVPYFQPKYDLSTKKLVGSEALIRWIHPEKGLVSPALFIPTCEKNGLIARVDYYMWDAVCAQMRTWIDKGINPGPVSVNMSRVNLYNPRIVEDLCNIVDSHNIDHRLLQIEVTESAFMDNPTVMSRVVDSLHERGFSIHMDDFGSGYSSLSALKDIDVDVLKIDMRFLSESERDGRGASIIASVLRMAKWLGIPSTTEGVETQQQADFLRSVGCEFAQGFFFARPMPAKDFEELLRTAQELPDGMLAPENEPQWDAPETFESAFTQDASPLCVVELSDNHMDIIRVNNAFCRIFGTDQKTLSVGFPEEVDESSQKIIMAALHEATQANAPIVTTFKRVSTCDELTMRTSKLGKAGPIWILACEIIKFKPANSAQE